MNCGLGNLDNLKKHLLPASVQSGTDYDTKLAVIGKGVAALFDTFLNRKLAYAAGDTVIFSADRPHFYLPRYPLVSVSAVESRFTNDEAWASLGTPLQINEATGLLHLGYSLAEFPAQIRATFTGGYWFETKEPADQGYPTAQPTGVTALTDDLKLAWLTQCAEVWNRTDQLGVGLAEKQDGSPLSALDFSPLVQEMLRPYRRFQLS